MNDSLLDQMERDAHSRQATADDCEQAVLREAASRVPPTHAEQMASIAAEPRDADARRITKWAVRAHRLGLNPFSGPARIRAEEARRRSPRATRRRGAGRPAGRTAVRSSARSRDSDDPEPEPPEPSAPPAARAAVARAWADVLRRRHPGVSWQVSG